MKLHRFYIQPDMIELTDELQLTDKTTLHQWRNVLRFQVGQRVVLFDGVSRDRRYTITELSKSSATLCVMQDEKRILPWRSVTLYWALLKRDNNNFIVQKATELGVSVLAPITTERCIKTGFNRKRAQAIAQEASEQCGRSDIPIVREPVSLQNVLETEPKKSNVFVAEQNAKHNAFITSNNDPAGVLIGPEGGWSNAEKKLFEDHKLPTLGLSDFTLRAETAAMSAVSYLMTR